MNFSNLKISKYFICFIISIFSLFATPTLSANPIFDPMTSNYFSMYHANGSLIWDGDQRSPFYHDNGEIAWLGPKKTERHFHYDNGQIAWRGGLYKDTFLSYESCSVYHKNGNLVWKGGPYNEPYNITCNNSTVYHSNGEMAWRGGTYADTTMTYSPCALYYSNGKLAWKGATSIQSPYSYGPSTVYHSDGSVAWRGYFAKDNSKVYACGLYYENGQLAWSGKSGDPLYDKEGNIQAKAVAEVELALGDNSWLYVSASRVRIMYLSIGDGSHLIFSSQDEKPVLAINLGLDYLPGFLSTHK